MTIIFNQSLSLFIDKILPKKEVIVTNLVVRRTICSTSKTLRFNDDSAHGRTLGYVIEMKLNCVNVLT